MKKRNKIILTTALTFGVAGGVMAYNAGKYCDNLNPQEKVEMINERVTDRLVLNTEQQARLGELTSRAAEMIAEAKSQRIERDAIINSLLDDQPVDQIGLLEKITEKTTLVDDSAPEMIALLAGFVDSLNAEQKAEIREFIEHKRSHHHDHGGWGRH